MKSKFLLSVLALSVLLIFSSCKKNEGRTPLLTTSAVSPGVKDVQCSGVIYSEGDAKITERGFYWGTEQNLMGKINKVICRTQDKNFKALLQGLASNTNYYLKAYAVNEYGTAYGKILGFITSSVYYPNLQLSTYTYPYYFYPTASSMSLALSISQQQAYSFKSGFCWSKNQTPTLLDSVRYVYVKNIDDPVPFNVTNTLTLNNLSSSTNYYARPFTINAYDTVYGNTLYWTTLAPVLPVVNFSLQGVGHTSVTSYVQVTSPQSNINTAGICWSENPNPVTSNNKLQQTYNNPTTFNIQNLQANKTYYLRAYVIYNSTTVYSSDQKTIRTLKGTFTDVNGNAYNTVELAGLEWMTSNFRASSFNNGTTIPEMNPNTNFNQFVTNINSSIPQYCYYGANSANNIPHGKLYPFYVAQNLNFPPTGWRLPTAQEWQNLINAATVNNLCIQNGSWTSATVTNPYGFSLYASGYWSGGFSAMGSTAAFWTVPVANSNNTFAFSSTTFAQATKFPTTTVHSVRFVRP